MKNLMNKCKIMIIMNKKHMQICHNKNLIINKMIIMNKKHMQIFHNNKKIINKMIIINKKHMQIFHKKKKINLTKNKIT